MFQVVPKSATSQPDLPALRQVGAVLRVDVLRGHRGDRGFAGRFLAAGLLVLTATAGGKDQCSGQQRRRKNFACLHISLQ